MIQAIYGVRSGHLWRWRLPEPAAAAIEPAQKQRSRVAGGARPTQLSPGSSWCAAVGAHPQIKSGAGSVGECTLPTTERKSIAHRVRSYGAWRPVDGRAAGGACPARLFRMPKSIAAEAAPTGPPVSTRVVMAHSGRSPPCGRMLLVGATSVAMLLRSGWEMTSSSVFANCPSACGRIPPIAQGWSPFARGSAMTTPAAPGCRPPRLPHRSPGWPSPRASRRRSPTHSGRRA